MKKKGIMVWFLICFFSHMGITSPSYADNAEILPKGVSRVDLTNNFYFPIDERYDEKGNTEDAAADLNIDLTALAPDLGLPPGFLGMSVVSFNYKITYQKLLIQHGVTDKLSAGVLIPYYWQRNEVEVGIDSTGAVAPLTVEGAQDLLVQNFGYKRVETWSDSGLGDIEAGGRYQYFKTDDWRLAFTGGVRLPTGETDDPDNAVDLAFGDGAYALLFQFNHDYIGIEDVVLNATFRYDLVLPDKETVRVPNVKDQLTDKKEELDRDLGDMIELEASGTYEFSEGFSFSVLYQYAYKLKDDVSGTRGYAYESLETDSDQRSQLYKVGLSYSTIPLFKAKRFPVPMIASISYRNRFAGSGNVLKSEYISFALSVYF